MEAPRKKVKALHPLVRGNAPVAKQIAHVFQHCPDHEHIRTRYTQLIRKEVGHDIETKDAAKELFQSDIFQLCGIMPECRQLIQWQDQNQEDEGEVGQASAR